MKPSIIAGLFLCVTLSWCASFAEPARAHTLNPLFVEKLTGQPVEDHHTLKVDPRFEERTFASFPEWYIVYSAQEYATFVAQGSWPSQFPYFRSSHQYWESVDAIRAMLGSSTVDSNTNTVLRVIGVSFTVENAIIGVYEKTIGRGFEALSVYHKTVEDYYTEGVAAEYGEFLLHTPWYAFPYGHKLVGLWRTFGWSSLTPRGIERRIVFTVGYTLKGIYGTILGKLSQASLGSAQLTTSMTLEHISALDLANIEGVQVETDDDEYTHLHATAPRYRAFTHIAEAIAKSGGLFQEIEGHQNIMLSVVTTTGNACLANFTVQFAQPIVTHPELSRVMITTEVTKLSEVIQKLADCNIELEHIYDY